MPDHIGQRDIPQRKAALQKRAVKTQQRAADIEGGRRYGARESQRLVSRKVPRVH
jgi:hypothetical protein